MDCSPAKVTRFLFADTYEFWTITQVAIFGGHIHSPSAVLALVTVHELHES